MVVDSLMDAVAALKLEAYHQSPPATYFSVPSVFWDFGSLYQKALRRHLLRAVAAAGFVSRHKPAEHHIAMFLHLLSVQNFLMDVLHMFWGFGSLCQWRCGVFCAGCCGSRNLFLPVVAAPLLPAVVPAVAASAVDITACSLTKISYSRAHGTLGSLTHDSFVRLASPSGSCGVAFSCLFLVHRWWSADGLMNLVEDRIKMPESIEYTCSQGLITCLIPRLLNQVGRFQRLCWTGFGFRARIVETSQTIRPSVLNRFGLRADIVEQSQRPQRLQVL